MKGDIIIRRLIAVFGEEKFNELDQITEDCIAEWFYGTADGFNPRNIAPEEVEEIIRYLIELKIAKARENYTIDLFDDFSVEDYYSHKLAAESKNQ